ncbi:hypothetical protein BHM03_00038509 [Ensete ventricosum]|nr:hypothetical protein BHM03_00038509 [Ensete ventricosum]
MWRRVCVAPRRSALAKPHPSVAALRGRALSPFPPSSPSPKPAVFFSSVPGRTFLLLGGFSSFVSEILDREFVEADLDLVDLFLVAFFLQVMDRRTGGFFFFFLLFPISKSYALSCQETHRLLMFPYSGIQGKKRFDMDAPVGPFGTKVGVLVPSLFS